MKLLNLLTVLCLLLTAAACGHRTRKKNIVKQIVGDSTYLITYNDRHGNAVPENHQPVTLSDCQVYTLPNKTSFVFAHLPMLSPVNLLQKLEQTSIDTVKDSKGNVISYKKNRSGYWYRIKLSDGKEGYVQYQQVANFSISDTSKNVVYLVSHGVYTDSCFVAKYSLKAKMITAKTGFAGFDSDHIRVSEVRHIPMKGVVKMLRIDEDLEDIGGAYTCQLVTDNGSTLFALPSTSIAYDDGDGRNNQVLYVPTYGRDGRVHLFIDADIHNDLHWLSFYMESRTDLGVPPGELLIYTQEKGETAHDQNNQSVVLKDGRYVWKSHTKTATYYRWDGTGLKQVFFEDIPLQ